MREGDRQTLAIVAPGLITFAVVVLFVIAATRSDPDDRAVWFTAIAAGIAFVGVLAAGLAIYLSDVLERPNPEVWVELPAAGADGFWRVATNATVSVHGRTGFVDTGTLSFEARIHVTNLGRGVLHYGILNIQVLRECSIEPVRTTPRSGHYKSTTPFNSGQLVPGTTVLCNATTAERDYPPGHSFLYSVRVRVPHAGTWPLAAVLDGWPRTKRMTRAETRVDIDVS